MEELKVGDKVMVMRPYHAPVDSDKSDITWIPDMNQYIGIDTAIRGFWLDVAINTIDGPADAIYYLLDADGADNLWHSTWLRKL